MYSKKQTAALEVLRSIPPEDMRIIIEGCLGTGSAQADYKTFIMVYELFVLGNKTLVEIAKLLKVTKGTIEQKIDRMVSLVKREPIIIDKLASGTDITSIPVNRLMMSSRTLHALEVAGVVTVGELLRRGENDLLRTKNFGRKALNETKTVLGNLLSRCRELPESQDVIAKLKAHSEATSTGRAEWSLQDHALFVQTLSDLESKLADVQGLVELVLRSVTRQYGRHVQEGFVLPYVIWNRLWSWSDRQRHSGKVVIDVPKAPG